jgi:uncharacterized protein YaaW (UPF0174 family)
MKIYIVGVRDAEDCNNIYACKSKATALKRWNELRLEIIDDVKKNMKLSKDDSSYMLICQRMLKNLYESDYTKMDDHPHEEPFIHEMEVEE